MKDYRKKAGGIQAQLFNPKTKPWPPGVEADPDSPTGFGIFTLEHTKRAHEVTPGDWIIRGVSGELYACKPDIFAATYDPA